MRAVPQALAAACTVVVTSGVRSRLWKFWSRSMVS